MIIPDYDCISTRTADEEDELLYGDSDTTVFQSSFNLNQSSELERYNWYFVTLL
jgi:hypothetical protein